MPKTIQHRFTQGELDPKMLGRSDIDQYYGAAETMRNVITLTQGGFKRRGGLQYLDELLRQLTFVSSPTITATNGGTGANANDRNSSTSLTTTNNVSTTNPYVVAHYDLGSSVSIGVVYIFGLALTVSGTSSEFYLQASNDNSSWTNIGSAITLSTTAKDYSRRVESSYRYIRLARVGNADLGTNKVTLKDMNVYTQAANSAARLVSFEFNTDQSYMLCLTDKNIAVYLNGVLQTDVYNGNLTSSMLADINWAQSADTLIIFHEDMNPVKVQRQGANDYWTVSNITFDKTPYHAFTEVTQTGAAAGFGTLTPSAISGTITLTVSAGTFTSASVEQYCEGNGGLAKIIAVRSATVVDAFVEVPFNNTTAIAAVDWNYLTGYEATWSVTRGWPICGTFHNNRLWIGGSKNRPTTAWGSRVGLYYDFSQTTGYDDDGIEITLDTDQLNRITNIYSGRNLMIFTSGAEFIVPSVSNDPITPGNISVSRQSRIGQQRGLRVTETEGGVFYVQNGGQSIQEFIFVDTQQAYGNNIISLLSNHLISDPVDMALRRSTSIDDGALLCVVQSDGTATIGTIQRAQQIGAFTNQTTDGLFKAVGADYNDIYFVVERNNINYLERLNDDHLLDASVRYTTGLPATVFTGLSHLNGEECRVVADDSVLSNVTPSGGSATISRAAESSCEIGLWFQPVFKDLPVEFPEQKTVIGRLLNISQVVVRLYNTASIKLNGKALSFRSFGASLLDEPPPQYTGIKRVLGFRGWDYTGQLTITQDDPAPLTVLSISKTIIQGD
jgi:hypothetical protein